MVYIILHMGDVASRLYLRSAGTRKAAQHAVGEAPGSHGASVRKPSSMIRGLCNWSEMLVGVAAN